MRELTEAERRSLSLHIAVAARLAEDPARIEIAHRNLGRAVENDTMHPRYVEAWRRLLALPLDELLAKLVEVSEEMCALRQTSIFAGTLTPRERWRILDEARRA